MKIVLFLFAAAMSFGNVEFSALLYQTDDAKAPSGRVVAGDQVDKLGDNLMLVYRDSKGSLWFGTWGAGYTDTTENPLEDHDGVFWFNTLFRYRVMENGAAGEDKLNGSGIFSRVNGIGSLDDNPGLGTHKNGAYRFDGQAFVRYMPAKR